MIPYGRQDISEADIQAVVDVLRSDFLTQGIQVPLFEEALKNYCGAKYGVAVSNATNALHLACIALGVVPGDIVWTTPITFVASANCAIYCGAIVDFVDIDPLTNNISIEALRSKLEKADLTGKLPKIIIPVHLAGQSCDMVEIHKLGQIYGFKILEDASHAVGGKYHGEPIGNCRYSDIAVFSFHPVKIITTGEGGMLLTNDQVISDRLMRLRSHGITRVASQMSQIPDGPWFYEQIELGFNYRMTELQAALGLSQLQRLEEFIAKRQLIARRYDELLADLGITTPYQIPDADSALHLYIIRLQPDRTKLRQQETFERLRSRGILVNLHYIPIYRHKFFKAMGFKKEDFPEAEKYYAEAISLPIYPSLTESQQNEVITHIKSPIGHQTIF